MIRSYFLTAYRSLKRSPLFTFINVIGLSVGIAAFILITVFVKDELTYDRFHTDAERIYRGEMFHEGGFSYGISDSAAEMLRTKMPEVQSLTTLSYSQQVIMKFEEALVFENRFYKAGPQFFDVFDFSLRYGNEDEALATREQIVISTYIMNKYFDGENPIGKMLKFENGNEPYIVSGVLEDIPTNSSLKFNFVSAFRKTERENIGTMYAKLNAPVDPEEFGARIRELEISNDLRYDKKATYSIQRLVDMHLSGNRRSSGALSGSWQVVYLFSAIGLLILAIASINYINSSTARSFTRLKEIGVRKLIGASRHYIRFQFLAEAFALTLISVCIGAGLAEAFLPSMNELTSKEISLSYFGDGFMITFLLVLALGITLLAGLYPAIFASRFKAIKVLKGSVQMSRGLLRRSLVVFQFIITLLLIFGTQIVSRQLNELLSGDHGFNPEDIMVTHKPRSEDYTTVKSVLEAVPGVDKVVYSPLPYAVSSSRIDVKWGAGTEDETFPVNYFSCSLDFGKTLDIQILQGRDFDSELGDLDNAVMISAAMAEELPWENPVGEVLDVPSLGRGGKRLKRTIVGIYNNLNPSLKHQPMATLMLPGTDGFRLNIKLAEAGQEQTVQRISKVWEESFGNTPLNFDFLDDRIEANYASEQRLSEVFGFFTSIAILIAVLGIFGLSNFAVLRRRKEMGIRKVLGASLMRILIKLVSGYFYMVLLALLVAIPVGIMVMNSWLNDFALKVDLSPWIFINGGLATILIVVATVSYESVKAALTNPVEILRDE